MDWFFETVALVWMLRLLVETHERGDVGVALLSDIEIQLESVVPTIARGTLELGLPGLNAHHPSWSGAIAKGLHHELIVVSAAERGMIRGWLPLVLVKGPLFVAFWYPSLYVNTGGVTARSPAIAKALIDGACDLADEYNALFGTAP